MSKPCLAEAIHHALRTDVPRVHEYPALRAHTLSEDDHILSVDVSSLQLERWLREAVSVVQQTSPPSSSSSASAPLVVALALPSCSAEESACMLLVTSQPDWVFVPLDTRLPVARQYKVLVESRANRLMTWDDSDIGTYIAATEAASVSALPSLSSSSSSSLCCYSLNDETPQWLRRVSDKLPLYVLFTSGSTGSPKGVVGTRQGAYERVLWMQAAHAMSSSSDCVVRTTRLTFVDAVAEILTAILSGVSLVHLKFPSAADVHSVVLHQSSVFADVVAQYQVTRFTIVPSVLRVLVTAMEADHSLTKRLSSVQLLSVSGEALPLTVVQRLFEILPNVDVLNLYGSTEVSGDITSKLIQASMLRDPERLKRWRTHGVPISDSPINAIEESTRLKLHSCTDDEFKEICVKGGAVGAGYLVDGELHVLPAQTIHDDHGDKWFAMGDLCRIVDGELFLCGRRDRQVKIRGNRVQLEDCERALKQAGSLTKRLSTRDAEAVATTVGKEDSEHEMVAIFIVDVASSALAVPCGNCELLMMDPATKRELFERVEEAFGALYVPHSVVIISNNHVPRLGSGKIDLKELKVLCERHDHHRRINHKRKADETGDMSEDASQIVLDLVERSLSVSRDRITNEATWLELGGDSLKATLLSWELENKLQMRISAANILPMKIADLVRLCSSNKRSIAPEDVVADEYRGSTSVKFPLVELEQRNSATDSPELQEPSKEIVAWYSRYNQGCERATIQPTEEKESRHTPDTPVRISVVARVDLGKCIDASPLVVRTARGSLLVLVGSHSHKFVCMEFEASPSGPNFTRTLWTQVLDDRIEASATLSISHGLVVTGTYSGALYAMDLVSGKVRWKFQARDMIKSSAVIVDSLALAIVGAYDRSMYCLDLKAGTLVCHVELPGSVYSTPAYDASTQQLIVATTTGVILSWTLSTRTKLTEIWRVTLPAPVFTSLVVASCRIEGLHGEEDGQTVLVGCANGSVYGLNAKNGAKRWEFATEKPIFSSPCAYTTAQDSKWITFGSHDGKLRKLSLSTGELQWQTASFGSESIFASPFVATISGQRGAIAVVCAATTNGRLLFVNQETGELLRVIHSTAGTGQGPQFGEIFSSPVVVDGFCFVGTRNNELLVLKLDCE